MANHHGDFIWCELITPDPGGDYSMNGLDPQGVHFALVGGRA